MGLSNNEFIKGAIDILTFFIEGINKLTSSVSGGNGLIKSLFSLVTVLGALKVAKAALGGGLGWAGQKMGLGGQQGATKETTTTTDAGGNVIST
jgi:hypothetical protein